MKSTAVVLEQPERLALGQLDLTPATVGDVVVEVLWSGISTGTERLLYTGQMPHFPGMGYPLVPGYEAVGRVVAAGDRAGREVGELVFVPGARCFGEVRSLFGASASRLVIPSERAIPLDERLGEHAVLLALAATAHHAMFAADAALPDLIVGHGVLGRLLARLTLAAGHAAPVVWERDPGRRGGGRGYEVLDPDEDPRRDYRAVYDVSGDATILDTLIARLAPGGEIVLAGFYATPLSFAFPPAFMREARLRVAAQWQDSDLVAVRDLCVVGRLSLADLITHHEPAGRAASAYRTAFDDPACLKMVLDWSQLS